MSDEVFRQRELLTAAKLNRILAAGVTKAYVDSAVANALALAPPPEVTITDVQTLIENAIANIQFPAVPSGVVIDVSVASGNASVSTADYTDAGTLRVINASVAGRIVDLPSATGARAIVSDRTNTRAVTIRRGTSTYNLAVGGFVIVYLDGSANFMRVLAAGNSFAGSFLNLTDTPSSYSGTGAYGVRVNAGATGLEFYRRGFYIPPYFGGTMTNGEVLFDLELPEAWTLPALSGSNHRAKATVAATGSTTLTFRKNGSSIGTAVWSASGTVATITMASATSFAAGDRFTIDGPATADATLANVRVALTALWG